ncbi:MAG TPA: DNA-formamidopyrimidine glycosylase family protein [Candidatus Limnocylindria bacterium]
MPEWPDLHVLRGRIETAVGGRRVTNVRVHDPLVLRATRPLDEALRGRVLERVAHRGRFLAFAFDDGARLVVNPMLSGLFDLVPPATKIRATTAFALTFENDVDLRYRDDTRMGKVYLLPAGAPDTQVPQYSEQGDEAGTLGWTADEFARRAKATRRELRNLLMDDEFIAGIGNAYADEILWAAKLHPKRKIASLDEGEMDRLRGALRATLERAAEIVEAELPPELGTKVRAHMNVRGRAGEPCPRCGTKIVRTRHGLDEMYVCPRCQPPPKGQLR